MLLCLGIFYSWPFASHASHHPLPCLAQRPSTVTASILAVYRVPCSFPTARIATYILVWLTLPGRTRHSTLRLASTQLNLHLSRPDALAAPNPYPLVLTVLENEPYARRGGAVTRRPSRGCWTTVSSVVQVYQLARGAERRGSDVFEERGRRSG
jgi:hypothetical protein